MKRLALLTPAALAAALAVAQPTPPPVRYARQIQPLLADACLACHGPDGGARKADLRLDTQEGLARAFVPGKPDASPGLRRILAADPALRMPPPAHPHPLKPADIALLRRWVAEGARWEGHWAFAPPTRPKVPRVRAAARVKNPVDAFVLAKLEAGGETLSPEADRVTLLRRVTLDLTGLPPTIAEVDAFLADKSPDAYEKVVDRLLASPRYGERMLWDWLEAARYADSNGYQEDRTRTMWPWRDWVRDAFNRNLPYDRFVVEQIAGDLLPDATRDQIVATGFNRNHPLNGEGGRIPEESRIDYVFDRVETTSTVFLGLTMNCAKCHDHKFDPLTRHDYYSLFAFFNNVAETGAVDAGGNANPVLALPTPAQSDALAAARAALETAEARLAALPDTAPDKAAARAARDAAKKAVEAADAQIVRTMVMADAPQPRKTFVLTRGLYDKPENRVGPGTPAVFPGPPFGPPPDRLKLANWLVSDRNPLGARVAVNRFWQMLFGTGLVKTAEDFGIQGERPSHPELLDWLAVQLREGGWDVKKLLRTLVLSATYRQSSEATAAQIARDPENRRLARGPRFRMPSWMLRDQALAVSGLLVEKAGGPPVQPYQPPGIWEEFSFGRIAYAQSHGEDLYRRSVYAFWRRTVAPTLFFDAATRTQCTVRTARTNTPLHALTLLNDTTFVEAARVLAERVSAAARRPEARLALAFRHATGRPPGASEAAALRRLYNQALSHYAADRPGADRITRVGERPRAAGADVVDLAALTTVTSAILNLDEVQTRE